MGAILYLSDFEDIVYERGSMQHWYDNAGTGEFDINFNYNNFNGRYKEILLDNFRIGYGRGSFAERTTLFFEFDEESVEMHFAIKGNSSTSVDSFNGNFSMNPGTHNIFYGSDFKGKLEWNCKEMFFLEINIKPAFFEQYLPVSGQFDAFRKLIQSREKGKISAHNHPITSEMLSAINDLVNCSLKDGFRKLFLESKVLELLLLQLNQMQQCEFCFKNADKAKGIVDKMYLARDIVTRELNDPLSLSELAKMVSTNECTLKKEFKNVFGTTVFGYIRNEQMERAKNVLLHQNITISQVSEMIGYSNPQHFSTAFKRKFGISPSQIRNK